VILFAMGAIAIACAQLVGIEADPPLGGCAECKTSRCAAQERSCNAKPECARYISCFTGCGADAECRALCAVGDPLTSEPEASGLRACLAASCASECGFACGAQSDLLAPPDAAKTCEACIDRITCEANTFFGTDPKLLLVSRCQSGCRTPDCAIACAEYVFGDAAIPQPVVEAGADGALPGVGGACFRECAIGENWSCLGRVAWPLGSPFDATTLVVHEYDYTDAEAPKVIGLRADLCAPIGCSPPIMTTTTDDVGNATFIVPQTPGALELGPTRYARIAPQSDASDLTPVLAYWGFPLSQSHYAFGSFAVTSAELRLTLESVQEDAGRSDRGHIYAIIHDCAFSPARHVKVESTNGTVYYYEHGQPAKGLTETTEDGVVGIANAEPGTVTIKVTPTSVGAPSHRYDVEVRAGEITLVNMYPTP
jgi:hypothetical protein